MEQVFDIKKFREDFNLSQRDLAGLLRVPQSFISKIENGHEKLPPAHIEKLKELYPTNDFSKQLVAKKQINTQIDDLNSLIQSQQKTIENLSATLRAVLEKK